MTAPVPRTFINRLCVCGECWCAQCPWCHQTVTRHNLTAVSARLNVDSHIRVHHPEKVSP